MKPENAWNLFPPWREKPWEYFGNSTANRETRFGIAGRRGT